MCILPFMYRGDELQLANSQIITELSAFAAFQECHALHGFGLSIISL